MSPKLKFTINLAKKAGKIVLQKMDNVSRVEKKDARDVCTDTDIKVEQMITDAIRKKFPKHNIMREEHDDIISGSEYVWIIDAIDGTNYFIQGIKLFNVSIALWRKGKPILGVVYSPGYNDCYWAEKNYGAFLNNKKISVSKRNTLKESIIGLDFNKVDQIYGKKKKEVSKRLNAIMENFYRFRVIGNGSMLLAWLARGYFDAYFDITGQEDVIDIGAGLVIAQEAGAKITDLNNKFPGLNANHTVVTNGKIHNKLLKILN